MLTIPEHKYQEDPGAGAPPPPRAGGLHDQFDDPITEKRSVNAHLQHQRNTLQAAHRRPQSAEMLTYTKTGIEGPLSYQLLWAWPRWAMIISTMGLPTFYMSGVECWDVEPHKVYRESDWWILYKVAPICSEHPLAGSSNEWLSLQKPAED